MSKERGKNMWEYVILFGVLIIAAYAVFQVERQGTAAMEAFNQRLKAVEIVNNSQGDSITELSELKSSLATMATKNDALAQNIEKLAQVITKNIEQAHLDIERIEKRLDSQRVQIPSEFKLVLANPKEPINMRVVTQSRPYTTQTETVLKRAQNGWQKKTKTTSTPKTQLPGLKSAKKAMAQMEQ